MLGRISITLFVVSTGRDSDSIGVFTRSQSLLWHIYLHYILPCTIKNLIGQSLDLMKQPRWVLNSDNFIYIKPASCAIIKDWNVRMIHQSSTRPRRQSTTHCIDTNIHSTPVTKLVSIYTSHYILYVLLGLTRRHAALWNKTAKTSKCWPVVSRWILQLVLQISCSLSTSLAQESTIQHHVIP